MVDNRYTGVGYEPPFETPSDKDFMASHIEALEVDLAAAQERERVLREAAQWALYYIRGDLEPHEYSTTQYINSIKKLQAALERKEG